MRSHLVSHDALNYLDDQAVAAYFAAREHEAYYLSLKSVDERRAFHEDLKASLGRLLELADVRAKHVLDEIIARTAGLTAAEPVGDPLTEMRRLEPDGVRLLGLDRDLDFDRLRSAYRSAARRHHPDRGGSNEEMAAVNRAYEQLHARLARQTEYEGEAVVSSWRVEVRTSLDYMWSATRLLFAVAVDDWALDDASLLLERLSSDFFARSAFARNDDQLIGLIEPAAKLAERLSATKDRTASERALAVTRAGLERAQARGLFYDPVVAKAAEVVAGQRAPRFVLNHVRQLENARRLGAIDEKRYEANLARLDQRQAAKEIARAEQEELLRTMRFVLDLPVDRGLRPHVGSLTLIPQPGYYEVRSENLSADQQAEYLRAYGAQPELELVKKYAFVRLGSLLRSAVYFPDQIEPSVLSAEALALARLEPRCAWVASRAAEILGYFAVFDGADRRGYATELRELLEPRPTGSGFLIIVMPEARELSGSFLESAQQVGRNLVGDE